VAKATGFPRIDHGALGRSWDNELMEIEVAVWSPGWREHLCSEDRRLGEFEAAVRQRFAAPLAVRSLVRGASSRSAVLDRWWSRHPRLTGGDYPAAVMLTLVEFDRIRSTGRRPANLGTRTRTTGDATWPGCGEFAGGRLDVDHWVDIEDGSALSLNLDGTSGEFTSFERHDCIACGMGCRQGSTDEDRSSLGADPCIGELPGVLGACCGHGMKARNPIFWLWGAMYMAPYVALENEQLLRGRRARTHMAHPEATSIR